MSGCMCGSKSTSIVGSADVVQCDKCETRWAQNWSTNPSGLRAALQGLVDGLPTCIGAHVSGSGGHSMYSGDCDRVATWTEDAEASYQFCDEHRLTERFAEEHDYADALRKAVAVLRGEG